MNSEIYNKLIKYGFADWQAKELIKHKKINTMHGDYKLKSDQIYLNNELVKLEG